MIKYGYVYIVTNKKQGTLYIGVTNDLVRRIYEHKNKSVKGFTSRYNLTQLVYYETHEELYEAISREKKLKNWHRDWKIKLIERLNPQWNDLTDEIF